MLLLPAHNFKLESFKLTEYELKVLTTMLLRASALREEIVTILDDIMEGLMGQFMIAEDAAVKEGSIKSELDSLVAEKG